MGQGVFGSRIPQDIALGGAKGIPPFAGYENVVEEPYGTISGGLQNRVESPYAVVTGGQFNQAGGETGPSGEIGEGAVVSGGTLNKASGDLSVVAGGARKKAFGLLSKVDSGVGNVAIGRYSSVNGGDQNTAFDIDHEVVLGSVFFKDAFAINGIPVNKSLGVHNFCAANTEGDAFCGVTVDPFTNVWTLEGAGDFGFCEAYCY